MKNPGVLRRSLWIGASVLSLFGLPAIADPGPLIPANQMSSHHGTMDWIQHTRSTLAELKVKLSLTSQQIPGWEIWSEGVTTDAHQQLESTKNLREEKVTGPLSFENATTPEQMTRGINRLHAEIDWMEGHVVRLEAAQARTQTFYETLDTNQKTIFDLFWHEMYHRSSGHDENTGDDEDVSAGAGAMMKKHEAARSTTPN